MLKFLRKKTKIIIWSVIGAFALWGGASVGFQFASGNQRAGQVFGKSVSFQEYNKFFKLTQFFSFRGDKTTPPDPEVLKQETWQNLIYAREAKRQKIKIADEEVRSEIQRLLGAQNLTSASLSVYERWVKSVYQGASPREFEEAVREILCIQKLLLGLKNEPLEPPSSEEVRKTYFMEKRKLTVDVISAPDSETAGKIQQALDNGQNWAKSVTVDDKTRIVENDQPQSLLALQRIWQLSDQDLQTLYQLNPGQTSPILKNTDSFMIFKIKDKQTVNETSFEAKGVAEKYTEDLIRFQKYKRFLQWNIDLMQRAKLLDLLPAPTPPPPSK
ncbi:MAG: SurA N-terminal domain-containing protein [Candidatus Omnitrophica bacterium]|nr:SurA N-terminal domain-containing protein [Candidatus Omnitrophota bacterium]